VQADPDIVKDDARTKTITLSRVSPSRLRRLGSAVRADALLRSSLLLIADYTFIAVVGALCSVIAARSWSVRDVGAVAGATAALGLITTAASSGIASTITRYLRTETHQRVFVLEAIVIAGSIGLALTAAICFAPAHLGVPLRYLPISDVVAFLLLGTYVMSNIIVSVTDPAFTSRQEVSFSVAKDITASIGRIVILIALIGTGSVGLLVAFVAYTGFSALIDLGLIFARLRNGETKPSVLRLRLMRQRKGFALGSHTAALVAALPAALFTTVIAAHFGPVDAAYVGVPLAVASFVSMVPSMTAQALLAELSKDSVDVAQTAVRALRLAYAGTLPTIVLLVGLAHYVLSIYGQRYAIHGPQFLRWGAAAAIFSTFNYVGDTVLLARQKVAAYNFVNIVGTVAILGCILAAVSLGLSWVGPALVVGQLCYATTSMLALLHYGSFRDGLAGLRSLRWTMRGV
jgi:O-antigen/teichoic acid export membrane protein